MTTRCKSGDIAIVLRDNPGCEDNIGRLVEVCGPTGLTAYPGMVSWRIRQVDTNAPWKITEKDGRITTEWMTWGSNVHHPDAWLKPIRPGESEEVDDASTDILLPRLPDTVV